MLIMLSIQRLLLWRKRNYAITDLGKHDLGMFYLISRRQLSCSESPAIQWSPSEGVQLESLSGSSVSGLPQIELSAVSGEQLDQ